MLCVLRMMTVPAQLSLLACLTLTVGLTLGFEPNKGTSFTFLLPAGTTECFFQTTESNGSMEFSYQVIAGSGLDVGFSIISPSGYRLASDFRRSDGVHMVHLTEEGDYRLCFDNSFSKLSEKMVFFEVIINNKNDAGGGQDQWDDMAITESLVEYQMEDIRASMESVYRHLERTLKVQAVLRAFEARDRYLLEDNLWRVSFWSCLSLLVMLTVAVIQIYTLRLLFEDKKRMVT
ncbi:transmembrane emp24 domain-containing protein 1-like [Notolabrus celidotus]|uniref:transmembrane emp24 domain-containing protein 1-like n=1 Tax=Notolabrus celidotus TaxID=1203425 RepID=UPI00148F62E7|nr:transmembrane emp24 domain-containing protein 1-like [Notolabrus celidotus]